MTTWRDTLYGVAYGDAWGAPHEFDSYEVITERHGPTGPDFPQHALITDDTQMTLSLADALHLTQGWVLAGVQDEVVRQYLSWLQDPDNTSDRAPGNTCLSALESIESGEPWYVASVMRSKGSGTVMRTAAAAQLDDANWRPVAAFQSAVTHGHPAATVACLVMTALLRDARDVGAGNLLTHAIDLVQSPATTSGVTEVLDPLLTLRDVDPTEYLTHGREVVLARLLDARSAYGALHRNPWSSDLCAFVGHGWVAEETLAVALLATDLMDSDPVMALRRAIMTGGDSDTIGAVAGALIGASHDDPWPQHWKQRLEQRYSAWLERASLYWTS